jgi:hypothetical protein
MVDVMSAGAVVLHICFVSIVNGHGCACATVYSPDRSNNALLCGAGR